VSTDTLQTVGQLELGRFAERLAGPGLGVRIGPFDFLIRARVQGLELPLHRLYQDYPLLGGARVYSARVVLRDVWRLLPRPERCVRFSVDGRVPHEDMPAGQRLAVLEWGLNLTIALRFHRFLLLHAAVVERNGRALLLPAAPGHGKTTLCAALVHRGWRLLSDEFGLIRPGAPCMVPVPRPMPLKNESIAVLAEFAPEAILGPEIPNTRKGTIVHVRPPASSVLRAAEVAAPAWIVFPRWMAGAPLSLVEAPKAEAFMLLASNAFNYELHGAAAFETVCDVVSSSRCYRLAYSDLASAVEALDNMAAGGA
jgi:HprK-related kinase A